MQTALDQYRQAANILSRPVNIVALFILTKRRAQAVQHGPDLFFAHTGKQFRIFQHIRIFFHKSLLIVAIPTYSL